MEDLRKMLEEEIASQIENLDSLEQGSDEHSNAVDSVAKLYKLTIEEDRCNKEFEEAKRQRETDKAAKEDQLKDVKIDRYFRVGSIVAVTLLQLGAYGHWYKKGLKLEETGTLTSPTMKGVISKFNPFKG